MRIAQLLLPLVFVVSFVEGRADTADESRTLCASVSNDHRREIDACTAVLAQSGITQVDKSITLTNRCASFSKLGMWSRALSDCNEAIEYDPKRARAYFNRGYVYVQLGQKRKAISTLRSAILIDPTFAEAYFNIGVIYSSVGRFDRAQAYYDTAVRLAPSEQNFRVSRGSNETNLGHYKEAIDEFTYVLSLSQDNPKALNGRCWARARANIDLSSALQDCAQAAQMLPNDPNILDSLGFLLLRLKRFDESISAYDRALSIEPRRAATLFGRGAAKRWVGEPSAARDIQMATSIDPSIATRFKGMLPTETKPAR